jgi:hypothetical protein
MAQKRKQFFTDNRAGYLAQIVEGREASQRIAAASGSQQGADYCGVTPFPQRLRAHAAMEGGILVPFFGGGFCFGSGSKGSACIAKGDIETGSFVTG